MGNARAARPQDALARPSRHGSALRAHPWLTAGGLASSAVVVALAIWSDFAFPEPLARLALAGAAIVSAAALALLARDDRAPTLRRATIEIGLLGIVALGWAGIHSAPGDYPLQHAATAAAITTFAATAALLVGRRRALQSDGDWSHALRQLTPVMIVAALGSLAATLGFEIAAQLNLGQVPMHPLAIGAILLTLLAGAGTPSPSPSPPAPIRSASRTAVAKPTSTPPRHCSHWR